MFLDECTQLLGSGIAAGEIELAAMKHVLMALLAMGVAAGCGKKEPELSTEKVITPDEAANKLFVEAVELVSEAKSKEDTNLTSAIKSYEEALGKVRKIVSDYKDLDIRSEGKRLPVLKFPAHNPGNYPT